MHIISDYDSRQNLTAMLTCFLTASFSVQIMTLLVAGTTLSGSGVSGSVSLTRADIRSSSSAGSGWLDCPG